jgi:hypothetical protein
MRSKNFRIGLDLDDCIFDFMGSYVDYFKCSKLDSPTITKNVVRILRKDRDFWVNLPIKNSPNFTPELYCTKRVNNKTWTKKSLEKNNLPNRPVYQMYDITGNKADLIKGKVDVFVDDSISNMIQLNLSGIPCLLMDTPYNQSWGPIGRIYSLNKEEIMDTYTLFIKTIFPKFKQLL